MAKSPSTKQATRSGRGATEVDKHVGRQMRKRRLELEMSQEGLAALLNVTFQQVQKYEKGVNRIAASTLYDGAHALDVDVNYFFKGLPGAQKRS
jgi:transcriptional regulator with XRE-family HTH domain